MLVSRKTAGTHVIMSSDKKLVHLGPTVRVLVANIFESNLVVGSKLRSVISLALTYKKSYHVSQH
jgi:hypothetical protein